MCHPQNDPVRGHYKCTDMGEKICLQGWKDEKSNCTVKACQTQNSTLNGHYTCSSDGMKICMEGWLDPHTNCMKGEI